MLLSKYFKFVRVSVAIVEDDAMDADLISHTLANLGYKNNVFRSAEQFIAEKLPGDFTHVFIDLKLPRISGAQLVEVMRKSFPSLRVIIVTGSTDLADMPMNCIILRKDSNMTQVFKDLLT